jgi:gliding motility-associated-like protein
MNIQSRVAAFIVLIVFALVPTMAFAQITSVANEVVPTEYINPNGTQDFIHIFCGEKGVTNASLTANAPNGESGIFEWMKYNSVTKEFDLYAGNSFAIFNLEDGCYRVKIASTSIELTDTTFTAWVFNNYLENVKAEILKSDCENLSMEGTFDYPTFTYADLSKSPSVESIVLNKDINVNWKVSNNVVHNFSTYTLSPPTKDAEYTFEVNNYGCIDTDVANYQSIVTKASFTYKVDDRKSDTRFDEAPLTVAFTNTSENGDAGKYEWFIFKDLNEIKKESAANAGVVKDSILTKIYTDSPSYIFERPGSYKVKLVSQKKSEYTTCFDTIYIDDYIKVDTSFIEAPNVFTPGDGNGENDTFVIRFFSMKTVKISIFNRWGKVLHVWESNNVQGFYNTASDKGANYVAESVWDGKVGGKLASPGVYYYVVEGTGRDDKRQRTSGFFHLFRGK